MKKRLNAALVLMMIAMMALSGNVFAAQYIGEAQAKTIALNHAKLTEADVTFYRVRQDRDDGRIVYEIEFYSATTEYDYEIDALTGRIREYDRDIDNFKIPGSSGGGTTPTDPADYIGKDAAKAIALADAGLTASQVKKVEVELDRGNRKVVYEIEFQYGRMEYEYEIDAVSGAILKSDAEYDD